MFTQEVILKIVVPKKRLREVEAQTIIIFAQLDGIKEHNANNIECPNCGAILRDHRPGEN
jgi:hypothetical protein